MLLSGCMTGPQQVMCQASVVVQSMVLHPSWQHASELRDALAAARHVCAQLTPAAAAATGLLAHTATHTKLHVLLSPLQYTGQDNKQ